MSSTTVTRLPAPAQNARLEFQAGHTRALRSRMMLDDVVGGIRLWRLAVTLGWLDIKLRYRGSLLGPFWLTLSTGAMVGSLGVLYSTLFKVSQSDYMSFYALSQVLWTFIASIITEGCIGFTSAEGIIRSVRMPFFVHSIRSLVRNLLVLAHNALVIVVVFAVYRVWPGWHMLAALPGLLLWAIDGLAVAMVLGAVCARFRDIPPIVASFMTIAFFVTPIIWEPKQIGPSLHWMLIGNPFFDLMEIVREPFLGSAAGIHVWLAAIGFSVVLCAVSWAGFSRARARIAFWL